jgi:hypothetical protein
VKRTDGLNYVLIKGEVGPVTEQSEHLSNAQIENYGNRSSAAGPEAAQRVEPQRVDVRQLSDQQLNDRQLDDQHIEAHLADCPSCRNRLLDFHRTRFAVLTKRADPQLTTAATSECPSDDDLRQLAAGLYPNAAIAGAHAANEVHANKEAQTTSNSYDHKDALAAEDAAVVNAGAAKLIQHAATCDHCGPLLKTYTEEFSDDFGLAEQAALANLQSSSPAWQKSTARLMLKTGGARPATSGADAGVGAEESSVPASTLVDRQLPARKSAQGAGAIPARKPFFWKWILVPATAAVVAVAAISIWYTQRDTPEKVEKLLAQAYTEQRTMEMRFPGAAYSSYKQTRSGDAESLLNSPASLRKAANLIDSQLAKKPDDPAWLLLNARLNLLDWRYKPALAILDKIEDAKVIASSEMRMTRALALYEQAVWEPERKDQTYGEIIDLMGKTLQGAPDDPAALFNRALACEKIHAYECAIADYERLSKENVGNGWSREVKDRLSKIKEKKTLGH